MCDDWDDNADVVVEQPPRRQYRPNNYETNTNSFADGNWSGEYSNSNTHRRPPRDDRRRGFRSAGYQNDRNDCTVIKVPSKFVGRIIGRGGSKISDLQFESGAKINITKETDGDETVVKLMGDSDAVAKAESLIKELTIEREFRPNVLENKAQGNGQEFREQSLDAAQKKPVSWRDVFKQCEQHEQAQWEQLPAIVKHFYEEHPQVTAMSQTEVEDFRVENNNIVVERTFKTETSKPVPKPVLTFEHAFHNYPEILEEIAKAGFSTPSPIQSQAWPVLLSGEDLIGIAQTGTGKTLAFLLPAMIHIDGQNSSRQDRGGPAVLVMAPTRELALQIDKEVKKYQYRGITAVCVYGGGNRREQIKVVTDGVDIVIATPGRLNDLVEAGHLNVKYVTYVVLDEADRMLDMGFEPQIRKIMYGIRPTRQTVMTSATWPLGVRRLAQSYMVDPIQVYVGTLDLAATHTVTQIIELVPDNDEDKFRVLMEFIQNLEPSEKVIVFCGKKARADELSTELILNGFQCQTIHGNRDQSDREQALLDIADGTVQILIATDVASRGLDIDDITHVINYDFPRNIEEYVHRVGRTGRAGKTGNSISYFTRGDWGQAKELIAILEEAQQYVPEELYGMAERYAVWKEKKDASRGPFRGGRGGGGGRRKCHNAATPAILPVEESKFTLVLVFLTALIFFLIFLGMLKGLIGICCCGKIGAYGLNMLIDLPRPLSHYQEKQLERRPVIYDIGGWPVHPDTLEKTVRPLPKRTEFCLNLIFFLAYPLAACVYLCALCCCIKNFNNKDEGTCFKHVDIVRLTNRISKNNKSNEDYKEEQDTKYVIDAMHKSKASIHEFRIKTCGCHLIE